MCPWPQAADAANGGCTMSINRIHHHSAMAKIADSAERHCDHDTLKFHSILNSVGQT